MKRKIYYCLFVFSVFMFQELNGSKKEVDVVSRKGHEYQTKAFQTAGQERERYFRKAIEEYKKVIYLAPDSWDGYFGVGTCYEQLSELDEAIKIYSVGAERVKSAEHKHELLDSIERIKKNRSLRAVSAGKVLGYKYDRGKAKSAGETEAAFAAGRAVTGFWAKLFFYVEKIIELIKQKLAHLFSGSGSVFGCRSRPERTAVSAPLPEDGKISHDLWEDILFYSGRGEHGRVINLHQNLIRKSDAMGSFQTKNHGVVHAVPSAIPYFTALIESYSKMGRWEDVFKFITAFINRRGEIKDIYYSERPIFDIFPELTKYFNAYVKAQKRKMYFTDKLDKNALVPRLWIFEIKGEDLFTASISNAGSRPLADEVLGVGYWGGHCPYRILINFQIEPIPAHLEIEKAEMYLFRQHRYGHRELSLSCLPVICQITSSWDRNKPVEPEHLNFSSATTSSPDIDTLMRRDIGRHSGGYVLAMLYLYDITPFVQEWRKGILPNNGLLMKLTDESEDIGQSFCSTKGLQPPKVNIIIKSETEPDIDDPIEYQEDWIALYVRGLDYLYKGGVNEAKLLWLEAKKRSGNETIEKYVDAHIAAIKGSRKW